MAGIDHLGLGSPDFVRARAFYETALRPLGVSVLMESGPDEPLYAGFGGARPFFWLYPQDRPGGPVHVAFRAESRAAVRAFHAAALAAGGRDNGMPGPRPHYHPDYFAAFVIDPDGHNVEAVCHEPEG